MNVAPMIFRFCSGIGDARQAVEKQRPTRRRTPAAAAEPLEPLADLRRFVEPQHAVVDEDAGQLVADRAVEDHRRDRRIDAAAQRADDAAVADLRANLRRRLLHKRRHRPVAGAAADAVGEVAEDLEAALGVDDFGMKQQRVEPSLGSAIAATGALALVATTAKPVGRRGDEVAVARPDADLMRHVGEQRAAAPRRASTRRVAELALRRRRHRPPSVSRHQLHAVADAQHRRPRSNTAGVASSARRHPDTLFGPPDRMMPAGLRVANRLGRRVRRPDLRIDRQLAQTTGDELRVLRTRNRGR